MHLYSLLNNNTTNTVELDSDNALELTNYLEEYRDMIFNHKVIFLIKGEYFIWARRKSFFDLLIIYTDGTNKVVKNVEEYGFKLESSLFYFIKNNFQGFIPKEEVRFIGRYIYYCLVDE